MPSPDYVWQRLHLAITCLCNEGNFTERLEDAAEAVGGVIKLWTS